METEEKAALALMQQIRALGKDEIVRRKEKKWKEGIHIKLDEEKKDQTDTERRKDIARIAGWKNKREADTEEGRGRSKRRET